MKFTADPVKPEPSLFAGRSKSLDALRALAALFVLFHHSCGLPIGIVCYDAFLNFFREYGHFGLDLFFVLSGFCIHWGHSKPEAPFDSREYMLKRWWRIYPPYFFALALAVFLNLLTNFYKWKTGGAVTMDNFGPGTVLAHLFLVHNLFPSTLATISGPFWTIAVEAQFYLIYLLVRRFFFTGRGWALVFAAGILLFVAGWYSVGSRVPFQLIHPFRYWIEWLAGAYLVYWLRKRPALVQHTSFWLLLFMGCWGAAVYIGPHRLIGFMNYGACLIALSFVFLILVFLRLEKIWSWAGLQWLPFLGLFSYSIYLIHFLIIDRVRAFIVPHFPEGACRMAVSLAGVAAALLAAYVFFHYFEEPFIKKSKSVGR